MNIIWLCTICDTAGSVKCQENVSLDELLDLLRLSHEHTAPACSSKSVTAVLNFKPPAVK